MNTKSQFIVYFKRRTKQLAIDVIGLIEKLQKKQTTRTIINQLTRSVTSVAANYRAACLARSKAEFHSKICIVVEEADETLFWLELIEELKLSNEVDKLKKLLNETEEIFKVVAKARSSNYK